MHDSGGSGILRAARGRCDWFAYGVYALPPDAGGSRVLLKQDSRLLRLQPIRDVI
jgi:hypothetical protein